MNGIFLALGVLVGCWVTGIEPIAYGNPYSYPQIRYVSPFSQSIGGVTLPVADEVGNDLFNNPAALARNQKFKAEYLNLSLDLNSSMGGGVTSVINLPSLGSFSSTLNSNINKLYSGGLGNLTAAAWGGLGVGLLIQERVRAYSDGTNVHYETMSQVIPAVGYGLALARGVIRLGYSVQLVNEASGITQSVSDGNAAYLSGLSEGKALSHTASVNFAFPFAYLPTFSLVARNIGGVHFSSGSIASRAKSPTGVPSDEDMSVDAAFDFTARISGPVKSRWYLQYKDLTGVSSLGILEKLNFGIDLNFSPAVSFRIGMTSTQPSAGIGYRSESSEINFAYYHDQSPFSNISSWDTRFALQYKVFFQDKNTRDRESELGPR